MTSISRRTSWRVNLGVAVIVCCAARASLVAAQTPDLLGDNIQFSGATLQLRPYATLPATTKSVIGTALRPGDARLYAATEQGVIYVIDEDNAGSGSAAVWFNVAAAVTAANGSLTPGSGQQGLQSVAFHPDFANPATAGYGKFYTTSLQTLPANDAAHFFLGDTVRGAGVSADSVLAEWTYDSVAGNVNPGSYRELFRVKLPRYDHMIKQAQFDPYARPGDEDYGLLYVAHGDSDPFDSSDDRPQSLSNALGKMLRIDPLPHGPNAYAIPEDNPFVAQGSGVLKEVYAYGFRNPHTYSFNRDDQGDVRILVGDVGRNNVEEIDLVAAGANYGWTEREGTFVHLQGVEGGPNSGYYSGVAPLPANEANVLDAYGRRYVYPVAQYDHNGPGVTINQSVSGAAVASGFVIQNSSDPALYNQLIFNNFASQTGDVYQIDFAAALGATTVLDPTDSSRDEPSELTQAPIQRLRLALDQDNNPNTPPLLFDDLNSMLAANRNDVRYGEGVRGEMYLSSKRNGVIYLVTNSLPVVGDYNRNGAVDGADVAVWRTSLGSAGLRLPADGTGDGLIDGADILAWQRRLGPSATNQATRPLAAPEPPSQFLLVAPLVLLSLRARRRRRGFPIRGVVTCAPNLSQWL